MPIYQSKQLSPLEPPDSMAALKALLGGNTGITGGRQQPSLNADDPGGYVQGAANRNQYAGEMRHNLAAQGPQGVSAALPSDLAEMEQDIQSDPYTGAAAHQQVAEEEALNQQMQHYGRPDVTEQRQNSENFALKKLLMPLQMKGQYEVEAAKQRAESQAARDTSLMGGRENVANINQAGQNERASEGIDARIRAQRLKELQAQKAKAAGNGLGNLFGLTGPSDAANIDAEIAQLMDGQPQIDDATPAQATNAPPAPAGWRYVPKPGGGWTAVSE